MGTNCAPLVADLFLSCFEKNFMMSLSEGTQSELIEDDDDDDLVFNDVSINWVICV